MFGRLLPSARLVEDDLIRRFGAKRHVIREALSELARMGIVTKERNKGATVRSFSLPEVEQIYEMREFLQERAIQKMPMPASKDLQKDLRQINKDLAQAAAQQDLRGIYRLNNEFHRTLWSACGNNYLVEAIEYYAWLSHTIRSYRIAMPGQMRKSRAEHEAMIRALKAEDRETLTRLCIEPIQPSKNAYLESIKMVEYAAADGIDTLTAAAGGPNLA